MQFWVWGSIHDWNLVASTSQQQVKTYRVHLGLVLDKLKCYVAMLDYIW